MVINSLYHKGTYSH